MTTGATIVNDAALACGALGQGDTLSADDSALILRRLNRLMDSWANVKERCYETAFDTFPTVAGTTTYATSLLANGRPTRITTMYVSKDGIDWPVRVIGAQEWADIGYKAVQSIPAVCRIDWSMPDAQMMLYPIPDGVYTVSVGWPRNLAAFTLAGDVILPRGYELAIVDALAVDIAPSFGRQVSPDLRLSATKAVRMLQATNFEPLRMDAGLHRHRYNEADFRSGI